jgi:hypothetical protein
MSALGRPAADAGFAVTTPARTMLTIWWGINPLNSNWASVQPLALLIRHQLAPTPVAIITD